MALPLITDNLDAVPEAQRGLYVEADGKFRLDVDGIEDTTALKTALERQKEAARDAKRLAADLAKKYEGIDPEKVRAMYSKMEGDAEAKLIAEGKIDEVVNLRTEKLRTDLQRQVEEAGSKVTAAETRAAQFSQRVLDNHIMAAAAKIGIHQHAIEDALFRGRNMFSLSEDGSAVQLGVDGKPIYGKDGKTLFSPLEWLEGSKEWAPHWHPAGSSGGGASGNGNGQSGQKTITRAQYEAMSPEAQKKAVTVDKVKITD